MSLWVCSPLLSIAGLEDSQSTSVVAQTNWRRLISDIDETAMVLPRKMLGYREIRRAAFSPATD
jgi:hypothetical protein